MNIADVHSGAERLINQKLREEIVAQGHHLTGQLENSLSAETSHKANKDIMEGFALHYAEFVQNGFPAESASMKQFPFLLEYFMKRGLPEEEAKRAAAATIKKWMKEGMPTSSSAAYSNTGSRKDFVYNALVGAQNELDDYMTNSLDFVVEESFQKEKSERI